MDDEDKVSFELRTIRNIIIKQNAPDDEHSVVFEIFNRLNSGGVNLKPQEIRTSLFHSRFYDMLYSINLYEKWRNLTPSSTPDLNMKDVEILLRGFAMLVDGPIYKPSMTKFLNKFSFKAKKFPDANIQYLKDLFSAFLDKVAHSDSRIFHSKTGRFNISVYESNFVASCNKAFLDKTLNVADIDLEKVSLLKQDEEFIDATQSDTASEKNVKIRIERAKEVLS